MLMLLLDEHCCRATTTTTTTTSMSSSFPSSAMDSASAPLPPPECVSETMAAAISSHCSSAPDSRHFDSAAAANPAAAAAAPPPSLRSPQLKCPRCDSRNTKFCYYNNYSVTQPRHFCKNCRRYWTLGGALRNVPIGGGCRKNKRTSSSTSSAVPAAAASISSPYGLINYSFNSNVTAAAQMRISPHYLGNRIAPTHAARTAFLATLTAPANTTMCPHLGAAISDPAAVAQYFASPPAAEPYSNHIGAAPAISHPRQMQSNLLKLNELNSSFPTVQNTVALQQLNSSAQPPDWPSLHQSQQLCGLSSTNSDNMVNLSSEAPAPASASASAAFIDIPDLIDTRFAANLPALKILAHAGGNGGEPDAMLAAYSNVLQQHQRHNPRSSSFIDVANPNFLLQYQSSAVAAGVSGSLAAHVKEDGDRGDEEVTCDIVSQRPDMNCFVGVDSRLSSALLDLQDDACCSVDELRCVSAAATGGGVAGASAAAMEAMDMINKMQEHDYFSTAEQQHSNIHEAASAAVEEAATAAAAEVAPKLALDSESNGASMIIPHHRPQLQDRELQTVLSSSFHGFSLLPSDHEPWSPHHHQQQQQQQGKEGRKQSIWDVDDEKWQDMPSLTAAGGTAGDEEEDNIL